ncbi:MAG TPA: hypothetical protein VHE55_10160 [Fimbriimonadaceae bacterium]|nr:hypothetical protein [Fimbriimonadaceae bacterium]
MLLTLWQVHGGVAALSTVAFVFLLQTANFSKRATSVVLNLAVEAKILAVPAYGFSTTFAIGLVLLLAQGWVTLTWPVVIVLFAAFLSNVVLVLYVLARSIGFLARSRLAEIERRTLLVQIEQAAELEVQEKVSLNWALKNLDDSPITSFFLELPDELSKWSVLAGKRRMVKDIDLARLTQIGERVQRELKTDKPVIRLFARLAWVPKDENSWIVEVAGTADKAIQKEVRSCIRWARARDDDGDLLLSDVLNQVQASVSSGDLAGFKDGLAISADILDATLKKLKEYGLAEDDGAGEMSAFTEVQRMLRFALEEALKTRRADFAITAGRNLADLAEVGIRYQNRAAVRQLLMVYPFLRRVILSLGVGQDPLYKELYWRSLKEMAFMIPITSEGDRQDFCPIALGVIEEVFVTMLSDSVAEGGVDLDNLLNGWLLTFRDDDRPRARRGRRGQVVERPGNARGHWMSLIAWAVHLAYVGVLDSTKFGTIFGKLAPKLGEVEDVLAAARLVCRWEDDDRGDLSNWIAFSMPEGRVYGIDDRTPAIRACVLVLVARALEPLGNRRFIPDPGSEDAAAIGEDVLNIIEGLRSGDQLATLAIASGIVKDIPSKQMDDLAAGFKAAMVSKEEQRKAALRAAALSPDAVAQFENGVRKGFAGESFFQSLPQIAAVDQVLGQYVKETLMIGVAELQDKRSFTVDGYGVSGLVENGAAMLARGEQKFMLEGIAKSAEDRRQVPIQKLLSIIADVCLDRGTGCVVIQGVGTRLDIYRHPEFRYPTGEKNRGELGSLFGVPIYWGLDIKGFAALYLPPRSVKLSYSRVRKDDESIASVRVRFVDEALAEETVAEWEKLGRITFETPEERTQKLLSLQEAVLVDLFIKPTATAEGVIVFLTDGDLDDDAEEEGDEEQT